MCSLVPIAASLPSALLASRLPALSATATGIVQSRKDRAWRAATGHLATRGADVALRVADVLADLGMPAALAPAVVAYAMQDVIDGARPAYFDDWPAVERSAREIPHDRLVDYIAALAADGPLITMKSARSQH